MKDFNPHSPASPRILATDLDGTLIPLPENKQNTEDLKLIHAQHADGRLPLIYATGRHYESVLEAIGQYRLPTPEWIICDVGSRIFRRSGCDYAPFDPYEVHLNELVGGSDRKTVEALLEGLEGLQFQQPDHQTAHKISYQCEAGRVETLIAEVKLRLEAAQAPYSGMGSLDPFLNIGLIDVLPGSVNKAYALRWLATHADFTPEEVVYSGDSGNDEAALSCGFSAIIVGNASVGLADRVRQHLAAVNQEDRLFCSTQKATSGVLEGIRHFGLLPGA
ncbi:MAG: HAD-IIB family hydrolase [Opitutales bacterium]